MKKRFIFSSLFLATILMTACTETEEGVTEETGDQATETEQSGDVSSLVISADTVSEQGECVLSS